LRLDVPGRADAVARLGGPLVHFVDFVTPEETSRQLGRVIIGAPAYADAPYDLTVTFRLLRGGETEQHIVRFESTTESHIVDAPFCFDGLVYTTRWEAVVEIVWRGETLTYSHQGKPLFPAIYAWRALIYDREEEPITPEQTLDEALDWEAYVQGPDGFRGNLNCPHFALLSRGYGERLEAGEPLAGYVATTVISPDERDAVLVYRSMCSREFPPEFYLNGQRVKDAPAEERRGELYSHVLHSAEHKTGVMRLRAGENRLLVSSRPPKPGEYMWLSWSFGGALKTVDGELMTDLIFE